MMKLALAAARATAFASRASGRGGGTTLPGRVLTALAPDAPRRLAARLPRGCVLVSATNGKTTTCALLAEVLRGRVQLARNSAGANLASGIASALAVREAATAELGLFECDEAALPAIADAARTRARSRSATSSATSSTATASSSSSRRAGASWSRILARRRRSSSPPTTRSPPRSSRSTRPSCATGSTTRRWRSRRLPTPPTRASACAAGTPTTTARPTSGTSATTPARTAATHARRSTWPRARSTCAASTARPSISAAATSACASSSRCRASTTSRTRSQRPLWRGVLGEPLDVIAEGLARFRGAFGRFQRLRVGDGRRSCCC